MKVNDIITFKSPNRCYKSNISYDYSIYHTHKIVVNHNSWSSNQIKQPIAEQHQPKAPY